jgi:hypothetical protein
MSSAYTLTPAPACAGIDSGGSPGGPEELDSRLRGNDRKTVKTVFRLRLR